MGVVVLAEHDTEQAIVLVNNRQCVELLVPNDVVRLLEGDVLVAHDELLARSHERSDLGRRIIAARTVVAAGHDAEQLAVRRAVLGDGHGGVAGLLLEIHDLLHRHFGREGGVGNHEPGLVVLHGLDHRGFLLGRLRTVDEGHAALSSERDAHLLARNGLHDGGNHRDVKRDRGLLAALEAHEWGLERYVCGNALGRRVSGHQQVLRERMGLTGEKHGHGYSSLWLGAIRPRAQRRRVLPHVFASNRLAERFGVHCSVCTLPVPGAPEVEPNQQRCKLAL